MAKREQCNPLCTMLTEIHAEITRVATREDRERYNRIDLMLSRFRDMQRAVYDE